MTDDSGPPRLDSGSIAEAMMDGLRRDYGAGWDLSWDGAEVVAVARGRGRVLRAASPQVMEMHLRNVIFDRAFGRG